MALLSVALCPRIVRFAQAFANLPNPYVLALPRELEADEDEAGWDERLRMLTKVKPEPEEPD